MKMILKIKRLTKTAKIPSYALEGDAGMDIFSDENYTLKPGETYAIKTGIAGEIKKGYAVLLWDKSGLGARSIHRFGGVIDSNYRGEWKAVLHNAGKKNYKVKKGDKIIQAIIQKIENPNIIEVKKLSSTERQSGAFGSTGKR